LAGPLSDRVIRRILKPLVFAASLSPVAFLLWGAFTDQLNVNPFNAIIRSTGFWSLRFLCLTLAITPLRWLTGWHSVVKFRRMIGLFGFFYGTVHTAAYVWFDRLAGLDASVRARPLVATAHTLSTIGVDLLRPFFAIGLVALVLMAPLAATSTLGMIRRLGGRRWQALHRLAYPAAVASVLHTYWPLTPRAPRYAVILGIVFVLRLGCAYARRRPSMARTVQAAG
jgi:sulfoxide reductase heme-binding subunit YedZ